ncbi:E3 ubiquitin/ISG15 ligase TRIM25-like [Discoglossus pictus]
MASDLREELNCCICLSIYTDPVILACGHNFCQVCIGSVLDTQEGSGVYTCPECRETFNTRPAGQRNLKLRNIMTLVLPTHPEQEETGIFCTYCIHSPVPATKSCLHCEASLCDNHVRVHSKSEEHVLSEPTTSWGDRKCSIHKKLLLYYCSEDAACICVSCSLAGEHRGHQVEMLKEASEKKKKKLRNVLEKLTSKREKTERRVQRLQEHRREVQERAAGVTETVTALIRDIRRQLEVLEKRVLSEITRQKEKVLLQVSYLIQQLEKEKDELSRKMSHIEELCTMTDPLPVLQDQESHNDDFCDTEKGDNEDTQREDKKVPAGGDLDEGLISVTLYRGLDDIVTDIKVKRWIYVQEASDILLDVNTAGNYVTVSGDLKTVTWTEINQQRPETPERFQCPQVLSTRSFSSVRHYWEVETSESGRWRVGMCSPSIERRGGQSWIGYNNKSWCLGYSWYNKALSVSHDSVQTRLPPSPSCHRYRISLDYEAGRLSFYELCDPIRHLHTFTATFTELLHVVFRVWGDGWVRIRS